MTFKIEAIAPDSELATLIVDKLAEFNRQQVGVRDLAPLCFAVKDAHGKLIGGALGETIWGWLAIDRLWVSQSHRGGGVGRALLKTIETAAIERGCHHAALETYSFQALPFYTRIGYEVYGQLDDFPVGQTRYSLRKKLETNPNAEDAVGRATEKIQSSSVNQSENTDANYLRMLHQITIDMLNHRNFEELIQVVVYHASTMLRAPLVELLLLEDDELVTVAFTDNQAHLKGDRVKRGQSLISWRALDSGMPTQLDDYSEWAGKRDIYDANMPRAVADFPVRIGKQSIGVLALGRLQKGDIFLESDIALGVQFSDLIALVIDHARREQNALDQLEHRKIAEALLIKQNAELDAYARTVAHDLKTPLTTLIGMARLLQPDQNFPEETKRKAGETIYRTALKMHQIIQALLSLSQNRLDNQVQMIKLNLNLVAQEARERLDLLIKAEGATLTIQNAMPEAVGHAPWLEEVLANLISNALKYGGKPARIEVGATQDGSHVKLWVRDFGPGIPIAKRDQLFCEFSRLGNTTDNIEGHGLGLSIVKRLAEAMNGQVGVEHPDDGGAMFWVKLAVE